MTQLKYFPETYKEPSDADGNHGYGTVDIEFDGQRLNVAVANINDVTILLDLLWRGKDDTVGPLLVIRYDHDSAKALKIVFFRFTKSGKIKEVLPSDVVGILHSQEAFQLFVDTPRKLVSLIERAVKQVDRAIVASAK